MDSGSSHKRIQLNILLVLMVNGAMGAPLLGPVRETLQDQTGLSRGRLGLWIFVIGTLGSALGLIAGILGQHIKRTTLFRIGVVLETLACLLLVMAKPGPGWLLLSLAMAWLLLGSARTMTNTGNGIFTDIWRHSPHTGVILLHAVNAGGKLLAPLAVLAIGTALRPNAAAFTALLVLLLIGSWFWPAADVDSLKQAEQRQARPDRPALPRNFAIWLCAVQFGFIAGSEAGATAILASLMQTLRNAPAAWPWPDKWPAAMTAVMLLGIVLGRIVFMISSRKLGERAILIICLLCGFAALPAALATHPGVYVPALLLTGVCFSATWPAFFSLAARAYPAEKTFLSLSSAFFTAVGVSGCIYLSSAVGNETSRLPLAFIASTAVMILFALYLFATPFGRRLESAELAAGGDTTAL